jgi:hypothetical protein
MERTYNLFEKLPDGATRWRASIAGHELAIFKLKEIAASSANEFQLMHLPTQTMNEPKTS